MQYLFYYLHVESRCSLILPALYCTHSYRLVQQGGVHHALNPDPYRGVFGSDGEKYAKDVQNLIDFGTSGNVAAFVSEAIQAHNLTRIA
jgi:4-aminobutyrate aminotransferase-like enzyme